MKLTKYLKIFEREDERGSLILLSMKKGSIISVPKTMLADIDAESISEEEKEMLLDLGFLAGGDDVEVNEMVGFIDELNAISRTLAVKIVMNLDCNLDCLYCFEGQRKGKFFMTQETAGNFVEFVGRWVKGLGELTGDEKIIVTFYGGEPLLSFGLVACISENIKRLAGENGIEYIAYMVTNGTLFTPRVVERLLPLGLQGAVITLDGPREVHDHFRPFKAGMGSFNVIMKNLQDVCEMVDLQIGGNYMEDNYRAFPLLMDYMLENGLTPDKISSIRFTAVTAECEGYGPADFHEGCCSLNEPWLIKASIYLRAEVLRRGFKAPDKIQPSACSLDLKNNLMINYDGWIYKCPGLIGREEFTVGNLKNGIRYARQPQGADKWKNEECMTCCYLPLCFGGCRYMKLVRDGNMDDVDCRKPYFDATLETLVKQDLKYGLIK